MPFVYEQKPRRAIETETNTIVRVCQVPTDVKNMLYYEFSRGDFSVRFEVWTVIEERKVIWNNKEIQKRVRVATLTDESLLHASFSAALKRHASAIFDEARYPEFRKLVEEGVTILDTQGGSLLSGVPDFRVEFV